MSEGKTPWELWKEKNSAKPWDLLKPSTKYLDENAKKARMDICEACPELTPHTKQCKQCGCFMLIKSSMEHASCPLGKW